MTLRTDKRTLAAAAADPKPEVLGDWLARAAKEVPDRAAVVWSGGTLTYGELYRDATRLARGLARTGFGRGDVIGVQLTNTPEFVVSYAAIGLLGAVICLLHTPYRRGELQPLVEHAGAKAVICAAATRGYDAPAEFAEVRRSAPSLQMVIVAGDEAGAGDVTLKALMRKGRGSRGPFAFLNTLMGKKRGSLVGPQPGDPFMLSFTSGTSAAPKCVVRAHDSLLSNQTVIAGVYGLRPGDRILSAPPFTHGFGICCINLAFRVHGAIVLLPAFTPDAFVEALGLADVVFTGPVHLAACLKAGVFERRDLGHIRLVGIAGSFCPPEVAAGFAAVVPNAVTGQLWGMTETIMALVTPQDGPEAIRHLTVGAPIPGVEVRIGGPDGRILPCGEEGELEIRGGPVFNGYYGNDEANRTAFSADGWFRTGDLAMLDEADNVTLTGRLKDIVNRGGIKFNPADVEAAMDSHPDVLQSAIVPTPDEVLGERACLCVVLKPGASLTLPDVQDFLKTRNVAKVKWPERLCVVDEMPMTPTRKVIKARLQAMITS